jgi:hypothetical protein
MFFDNLLLFCSCPIVGLVPFANRSDDGRESRCTGRADLFERLRMDKELTELLPPRLSKLQSVFISAWRILL